MEISKLYELCMQDGAIKAATGHGEWLIALHSTLSSAEQQTVFDRPPDGATHLCRALIPRGGIAAQPASGDKQPFTTLWVMLQGRHASGGRIFALLCLLTGNLRNRRHIAL